MSNQIIVALSDRWIAPQRTAYSFLTSAPRKIGDQALIQVEGRKRAVMVMLLKSLNGYLWLVECKKRHRA